MKISDTIRLPRQLESDPRGPRILQSLNAHTQLLWPGGSMEVTLAPLTPMLAAALRNASNAGQIVRGVEHAEKILANEEQGLQLVDRKSGIQRGVRLSRLLMLSDDGSERFYRDVESLLRRHGPRVLAIRLDVDAMALGELLYGPGSLARLLMIEHKGHVAAVLLALAENLE